MYTTKNRTHDMKSIPPLFKVCKLKERTIYLSLVWTKVKFDSWSFDSGSQVLNSLYFLWLVSAIQLHIVALHCTTQHDITRVVEVLNSTGC